MGGARCGLGAIQPSELGLVASGVTRLECTPSMSSPRERIPLGTESHHLPALWAEEDETPPNSERSFGLAQVDLGKLGLAVRADRHEIVAPHCSTRLRHRLRTHSDLLTHQNLPEAADLDHPTHHYQTRQPKDQEAEVTTARRGSAYPAGRSASAEQFEAALTAQDVPDLERLRVPILMDSEQGDLGGQIDYTCGSGLTTCQDFDAMPGLW